MIKSILKGQRLYLDNIKSQPIIGLGIIIALLLSFIPRFLNIEGLLPLYSLDENEITEYALGFFGGDKDPNWYKYGPLYWYILFFFYKIQAMFSGMGAEAFVEAYFIDGTPYFVTARVLNSILHILIAVVAYFLCFKHINKKAAPFVLMVALFPFADTLTAFKPRVDSLLALNQMMTLFFALFWLKKRELKHFLWVGFFLGLCVASKPIPSLLLLPTVFLIYVLSYTTQKSGADIKGMLLNKYWPLIFVMIFVGVFVGSPYNIINFSDFWAEQVRAIQEEGGNNYASGANLLRFSGNLGYVFIISSVLSLFYAAYDGVKRQKWALLVLVSFVMIYWLAFSMGAARHYFYVCIIGPLAILIAYTIHRLLYLYGPKSVLQRNWIKIAAAVLLFAQPFYTYGRNDVSTLLHGNSSNYNTIRDGAQPWIENNIPKNSSILFYGYYTSLPPLIGNDINRFANVSDHFMYNRSANQWWVDRYAQSIRKYIQGGGMIYDIVYVLNNSVSQSPDTYYTRYEKPEVTADLFANAQAQGIQYIMSCTEINSGQPGYRLVKSFMVGEYMGGQPVYIYQRE